MNINKIKAAESKADRLVMQVQGHPLFALSLNPSSEKYSDEVATFKLLFSQEDPDYRLALWNKLFLFFHAEKPQESDFTEAEYAFIRRWMEARKNHQYPEYTNINKPFATQRLLLRATNGSADLELYSKHLKEDGDFVMFTNLKCTKENIERFGFDRPFFFVIQEKQSGRMVGYVGLRWDKNEGRKTKVMECEYYIFKPYRHLGYASEALTALCRRAFSGKLVEMEETNYEYLCRARYARPQLIRAMIREDNKPSRAFVESCGFSLTGMLHRYFWVENKYCIDCCVYELTPSALHT